MKTEQKEYTEHKTDLALTRGMTHAQKQRYYRRLRKLIAKEAFEQERLRCQSEKRDRREQEIRDRAKAKAYNKYGMTRREKLAGFVVKTRAGIEKAQQSVQTLQQDLEQDLVHEGYDINRPQRQKPKKQKKKEKKDTPPDFYSWLTSIP